MNAPMVTRLPLLLALLLLASLPGAAGAHGAPLPAVPNLLPFEETEALEAETEEEGEEVATECDTAYAEADEGLLSEAGAEEVCEEEDEAQPANKARGAKAKSKATKQQAKQRAQRRKKACRHRASPRKKKRHCPRGPRPR
jgi:hypothetical protein